MSEDEVSNSSGNVFKDLELPNSEELFEKYINNKFTGLEALELLKRGHKIRCKRWEEKDWFLFYSEDSLYTFSKQAVPFPRHPENNIETPWIGLFNQEIIEDFIHDIFESEWEIIQ